MLARNCRDRNTSFALTFQQLAELLQVLAGSTHPLRGAPARAVGMPLPFCRRAGTTEDLVNFRNCPFQSIDFSFRRRQIILPE